MTAAPEKISKKRKILNERNPTMRWNEMTSPEFEEAVKKSEGVCLLPLGVIEKHGDHLPLGIDYMKAWGYADMASELEPAVVFPPYYTGLVNAATFEPGTFAMNATLVLEMLEATCAEIARNGLKKIILVNAHGGNIILLQTFLKMQLESRRDYMVYQCLHHFGPRTKKAKEDLQTETGGISGHGGAYETAVGLHLFPEMVKMEKILPPEVGAVNPRLTDILGEDIWTPIDWYAKHPVHLSGYGGKSTGEHGKEICEMIAEDIAETIRKVKKDKLSLELMTDFFDKSGK
jgi:creatinine amidohydrolase